MKTGNDIVRIYRNLILYTMKNNKSFYEHNSTNTYQVTNSNTNNNSAIAEHVMNCEHAKHLIDINNLYDQLSDKTADKPFAYNYLIKRRFSRKSSIEGSKIP